MILNVMLHIEINRNYEKREGEETLGTSAIKVDLMDPRMQHWILDSSTISNRSAFISSKKCKNISIVQPSGIGHLSLLKEFKTEWTYSIVTGMI